MKKIGFFALAAMVLTACSSYNGEEQMMKEFTLTFSPYEMTAISQTRAATGIADYCTRLDVWISEGGTTQEVHQSSADTDFGTVTLPLNRLKTYTLVAVAHKCAEPATLNDGVISFPDDKVTHSMVYTTTFCPGNGTSLSCEMQRIVGWFRLEIADAVPGNVSKIVYTIPGTYNRWSIAGIATNQIDRTGTINVTSTNADGSVNVNIYVMPSTLTATDNYDITISAQTANDDVVEEKTFASVPIKAGYKTTYHGQFFTTETMTTTFTCADWEELDIYTF